MRALVTGGAGFIGSHVVELLESKGFDVRVLDNLRSGKLKNISGSKCEFIEASILDRNSVRSAMAGVDFVFHLAAMVSVPESMEFPVECNEINTKGTIIVLEEAAREQVKKVVFSSSAAVYGDGPQNPKVETMRPQPKSPYAITKLDGEFYCAMFTASKGLPTACLRYFNVFGPRQDPNSHYAAAISVFIQKALKGEPITIYGDGEQERDFVFVKDVAEANLFFGTEVPETGVFNIGCGQGVTINSLAEGIRDVLNSRSAIVHSESRLGDVRISCADTNLSAAAGFIPQFSLSTGIKAVLATEPQECP